MSATTTHFSFKSICLNLCGRRLRINKIMSVTATVAHPTYNENNTEKIISKKNIILFFFSLHN